MLLKFAVLAIMTVCVIVVAATPRSGTLQLLLSQKPITQYPANVYYITQSNLSINHLSKTHIAGLHLTISIDPILSVTVHCTHLI